MTRRKKEPKLLRDMETPVVFGIELDRETLTPKRKSLPKYAGSDYGADPIGDGLFRMVPSGDVVSTEERNKR